MADTRLQLAHFHHHRPHKGARKHRVGEATPEPTLRPGRRGRGGAQPGLKHANPVAKAMGKVSFARHIASPLQAQSERGRLGSPETLHSM